MAHTITCPPAAACPPAKFFSLAGSGHGRGGGDGEAPSPLQQQRQECSERKDQHSSPPVINSGRST